MQSIITFVLASLLFITVTGCKKKPEATAQVVVKENVASEVTSQTTCPVMGGNINPNIFTEYKGKKVYFCCPSCKDIFEKDPDKYISKLPQFQN